MVAGGTERAGAESGVSVEARRRAARPCGGVSVEMRVFEGGELSALAESFPVLGRGFSVLCRCLTTFGKGIA